MDSPSKMAEAVAFCRQHGIEQLTFRPIRRPTAPLDAEVAKFVSERAPTPEQLKALKEWLAKNGQPVLSLMHGAEVYDLHGQNVCLSDCLTANQSTEEIRSLICFPDGRLAYDWQYPGAVLLGGRKPRVLP
jgi:hypothetical protein